MHRLNNQKQTEINKMACKFGSDMQQTFVLDLKGRKKKDPLMNEEVKNREERKKKKYKETTVRSKTELKIYRGVGLRG